MEWFFAPVLTTKRTETRRCFLQTLSWKMTIRGMVGFKVEDADKHNYSP